MNQYEKEYGQQYLNCMNEIKNIILESERSEKFIVVDTEAGLGKSVTMNEALDKCLDDWGDDRRFLIVKKFNEDTEKCVKFLEHHNKICDKPRVIGITSETYKEWKDKLHELEKVKVIFISHARYIKLCENDDVRKAFT